MNSHLRIIPFAIWSLLWPALTYGQAPEDDRAQVDVIVGDAPLERVPDELTVRARVTKIEPVEPTEIRWRTGGEGLGGGVNRGLMPRIVAPVPAEPDVDGKPKAKDDLEDLIEAEEKPSRTKQPPTDQRLAVGDWSVPVAAGTFTRGGAPRLAFVTFTAGSGGKLVASGAGGGRQIAGGSKQVELELEFSYRGKVIKTVRERGPEGGTVGIVIPYGQLAGGKSPTDATFLSSLVGLSEHAARRADIIEAMPWAKGPKPRQFAMITAFNGYGEGQYYGVRYANRDVVAAEARTLRAIGINGFQGGPAFLIEQAFERSGLGAPFHGGLETNIFGYPVPTHEPGRDVPGAGCPFHADVPQRTQAGVAESLQHALSLRVNSVWGITVDEIGAVVDRAPEGKAHLAVCPRCRQGFQEYLQAEGLTPDEFGATDWAGVGPINVWDAKGPRPWLTDDTAARLAYWTLRFNCFSSARLFTPHRAAFSAANEVKRKALAAGETNTPAARQPWVYAAAMRGNTFLMGGHSLDFFDFYRYADNAFIYETSNRDARVWQWDSYLCDVGRVLHDRMDKEFGILVKPHRGAPVQRALAAVARNAKMINWYTYGPEYAKGDSFAERIDAIKLVGQANDLIGRAEDVVYDTHWPEPPRIAIVKPRSSELWMQLGDPVGSAAWENAKWIYTALTHAHLAVDPIDEVILERDDLSQYRVIYVNGPQLTRAAAAKLAAWVAAGGTLWTSGGGLARDETNQPLDALLPTLGLAARRAPEMWRRVATYGATQLSPPALLPGVDVALEAASVKGAKQFSGPVALTVGREVLEPAKETEVLARFADGAPAMTRHVFGKGQAYVVGFFPGLEYMTPLLSGEFDMGRDFNPQCRAFITAPALDIVQPVVSTSDPNVEGVLVQNNRTGLRAILLMNWTYRVAATRVGGNAKGRANRSSVIAHVPLEKISVSFPAGDIQRVRSIALDALLEPAKEGDTRRTITLPRLAEGDVLLLE